MTPNRKTRLQASSGSNATATATLPTPVRSPTARAAVAASFPKCGTGGSRKKKTLEARENAISHFQLYLDYKHLGPFDELDPTFLTDRETWKEFAGYLATSGHQLNKPESPLALQTAENIYSGFKNVLAQRFPLMELFKVTPNPEVAEFHKNVKADMKKKIIDRNTELQIRTVEKSPKIGPILHAEIGKALLKANTTEGVLRHAAILTIRQAAGRSGEIAKATWHLVQFDHEGDKGDIDWARLKISRVTTLPIYSDLRTCFLDWYTAMALFLIVGAAQQALRGNLPAKDKHYMFPWLAVMSEGTYIFSKMPSSPVPHIMVSSYQQYTGSVPNTITAYIKDVIPKQRGTQGANSPFQRFPVEKLHPDTTSTGIRSGTA